MIRILLADHQALTAAGLISILQKQPDLSVVDQVSIPERTQELLEFHKPDIFIVDYHLPGYITIEVLLRLREAFPQINVLVISSDNDKSTILKVLQSGVTGYLTKECSRDEILMAVYAAARGEKYFCHKILNIIMEKHFTLPPVLTARETGILKLLATGNSAQKIADELFLILAFCASLIAASSPVTGFYIWWGRRKRSQPKNRRRKVKIILKYPISNL